MAKKARQRLAEAEADASFEFPEFDEPTFLRHEFEQTWATVLAFLLAVADGILSYLLGRIVPLLVVPAAVGIAWLGLSPFLIQRLRPTSDQYTRGEWAGLLLLEFFGWVGFWFLLSDVLH
ncbi:MAG TPA: hypothetical protein VLX64_05530 [Thermoplasmata archaeon]|nr:hypothetical protein [Thermoplasmata archaeon]HUJ78453.1 hypothetical protein [Thermoplasmata archaeon]